uniref:Uncharacterized protein n=1 Tax=Mycena chlorophos TaxID=658473 RepID=A0ABQ0KXS9_MYCCL|nr:predicted protein [Mycena chlorophos]
MPASTATTAADDLEQRSVRTRRCACLASALPAAPTQTTELALYKAFPQDPPTHAAPTNADLASRRRGASHLHTTRAALRPSRRLDVRSHGPSS